MTEEKYNWIKDLFGALGGCLKSIIILGFIILVVSWGFSIHWFLGLVIFSVMVLLFGGTK